MPTRTWTSAVTSIDCEMPQTRAESVGYGLIIPALCSVGIVCNILNLVILFRKRLDATSYMYLLGLSAADLTTVTCAWPVFLSRCSDCYNPYQSGYIRRLYEVYIYIPLTNISTATSIWITTCLTIERFIYVKYPLKSHAVCTVTCAKRTLYGVCLFALIFNLPYFLVNTIDTECNIMITSKLGEHPFFSFFYWVQAWVMYILPFLFLSTINYLLINYLRKGSVTCKTGDPTANDKYSHLRKSQNRLTIILIAIVFIFLFGNIPIIFAFKGIAVHVFGDLESEPYRNFRLAANILELVSFSMNFVIYCILDKKFQSQLKETCGVLWRREICCSRDRQQVFSV